MKARTLISLALLFAVGLVFGFQSAQEVFQQALSKERSEGKLKEAIVLYQKAIDLSKEEALSAKAQLQIGLCYEKLGLQEAEKAFRLVIEKYPGQAEAVKQAREKLAQLSASAGQSAPASGLSLRKLDIPVGIISPDGRYIASSEDEDELFLYDVSSQKKSVLRKSGEKHDYLWSNALWSLDSKKIAYAWLEPDGSESLNVWDLAAGSTKEAFTKSGVSILNLCGWSPDQKYIYLQYREKNGIRIFGCLSLADRSLRGILTDNAIGFDAFLSPDGRYLAYDFASRTPNQEIRSVSVNENSQSVLVNCQGSEKFIGWTSDSQGVLFTSDRSGMNSLWFQDVRNGKAENEPRFIAPIDGSINISSRTLKGALYYEVGRQVSDVFLAKMDPDAGKLLQAPKKTEIATIGRSSSPFWSADGRQLGYFFRKGLSANHYEYDTLKIINQETGLTREVLLDFAAQPGFMPLPRWTRDGKHIHFLSPKKNVWGLIRLDVNSGQSEMIASGNGIVAWSTDGSTVFIIDRGSPPQKLSEASLKIIRKNIDSGEQKILYQGAKGELIMGLMLSPNESFIGFHSQAIGERASIAGGVGIIPADSKIILARETIPYFFPLGTALFNWTYDGKGLIFQVWSKRANPDQEARPQYLYYPSIDPTLDPIKLDMNLTKTGTSIAFHPDGKTIAFTGQSHIYEFWVMENFLPKK